MLNQLFWIYFTEIFFFSLFSNLSLILAIATVLSRNPVHAILALMGVFISGSALMILVGAEFLGLVYLMVYVGALAVLFLFVIMMLNVKSYPPSNDYNANMVFLGLVPLMGVTFILYVTNVYERYDIALRLFNGWYVWRREFSSTGQFFLEMTDWYHFEHATRSDLYEFNYIKLTYYEPESYMPSPEFGEIAIKFPTIIDLFFELYKGSAEEALGAPHPIKPAYYPSSNIQGLGFVIYLKYFLAFISAGLILFVSMLGAILLTKYYKPSRLKIQQISIQNSRTPDIQKYRVPFF